MSDTNELEQLRTENAELKAQLAAPRAHLNPTAPFVFPGTIQRLDELLIDGAWWRVWELRDFGWCVLVGADGREKHVHVGDIEATDRRPALEGFKEAFQNLEDGVTVPGAMTVELGKEVAGP